MSVPNAFGALRAEVLRLVRFGLVGVAATLAHVGVLVGLAELAGLDPRLANIAGWAAAVPVSYAGHYHWTFARGGAHRETALRFVIVSGIALATSQGMIHLFRALGDGYLVAIPVFIVLTPFLTYLALGGLVFRRGAGR